MVPIPSTEYQSPLYDLDLDFGSGAKQSLQHESSRRRGEWSASSRNLRTGKPTEPRYLTFGNSTFRLLQSSMLTPEQPFAHSG